VIFLKNFAWWVFCCIFYFFLLNYSVFKDLLLIEFYNILKYISTIIVWISLLKYFFLMKKMFFQIKISTTYPATKLRETETEKETEPDCNSYHRDFTSNFKGKVYGSQPTIFFGSPPRLLYILVLSTSNCIYSFCEYIKLTHTHIVNFTLNKV
jgi:hypothetical protein